MITGLFTRFMDNSDRVGSKSLLDYGAIDNDHVQTVTSFTIDEDARYSCGSDHALLECVIEVGDRPCVHWSYSEAIHYNINGNTNYKEYIDTLDAGVTSIPLHIFAKLSPEEMLPHIKETVHESAKNTIGLKVKRSKRGRKLPLPIINLIRTKNHLARELTAERASISNEQLAKLEDQLNQLKIEVKDALAGVKLQQRHHLRSKVLRADPSRKKFWRFLKSQIKSAGNITAAYNSTGKMVFEQSEIEDALLDHFTEIFAAKRVPVFSSSADQADQTELALSDIEMIINKNTPYFASDTFEDQVCLPFTLTELEQDLAALTDGKACGYDGLANELLKNSGRQFKLYLQILLNKVIEEGHIPQDLNIGKCLLVHKV